MEIKTITFHCADNYGAVLQAYSLMSFLSSKNQNTEIIDYWPQKRIDSSKTLWKKENIISKVSLCHNLVTAVNYKSLKQKRKNFEDFRNQHLNLTKEKFTEFSQLEKMANENPNNVYFTGSDQVWNPDTGIDPAYYLAFTKSKKTISYAPSIGLYNIPEKYEPLMSKYIGDISYLSSREVRGVEHIYNLTKRKAETVVDPVFLQDASEWSKLVGDRPIKEDYILVYCVRRRKNLEAGIKKVQAILKMPVILIVGSNPCAKGLIKADKTIWDAGPKDFVNYIAHASFICTNSFHGTAFSLIFSKPFLNFRHTKGDTRAEYTLYEAKASERIITDDLDKKLHLIDKKPINLIENLSDFINKSKKYIYNALENEKNNSK